MSFADDFLADLDPRTWSADTKPEGNLRPRFYYLGRGDHALEVAVAEADARPRADAVRALWHGRQNRRPSPLLLVIGYPQHGADRVLLCGPVGDQPPLLPDLEVSQVERLCAAALAEPSRHAAVRFLVGMLPEVGSDLPGLRNSGLLATQELEHGVPARPDWAQACQASRPLLASSGQRLVEQLSFSVEPLSTSASVLASRHAKRAVAVFLDEGEAFEDPAARFGTSPVSRARPRRPGEPALGCRDPGSADPALRRPRRHRRRPQRPRRDVRRAQPRAAAQRPGRVPVAAVQR